MAARTPSQTVGPFFHEALRWKDAGRVEFAEAGRRLVIEGSLTDGAGQPVTDALIETWQLSSTGRTPAAATGGANPHGFGRVESTRDGTFRVETSMPGGAFPAIEFTIFARGLLKPLRTRAYLIPEAEARKDPALQSLASSPRIATLVAHRAAEGAFRWDIRLQGDGETIFFEA